MHIGIVGREFSKVLTQCGFSGYQQNQPNKKRFSHNHPRTSKDLRWVPRILMAREQQRNCQKKLARRYRVNGSRRFGTSGGVVPFSRPYPLSPCVSV
jgi:hypothetical protein